jgi:hypothetical protein
MSPGLNDPEASKMVKMEFIILLQCKLLPDVTSLAGMNGTKYLTMSWFCSGDHHLHQFNTNT